MSPVRPSPAPLFAALGDDTRLRLVARLCRGGRASITALTAGSNLTRQAVTKHLRVLAEAGLAHSRRQGRQRLWELEPRQLDAARRYLDLVSRRWDQRLARLKAAVER